MLAAAGIEWSATIRACVAACHVLLDGHLISTNAAEHCRLSPFGLRPDFNRMAGQSIITILAGEIHAAAFHLDGDNVELRLVMSAARLRIQSDSANLRARHLHRVQTTEPEQILLIWRLLRLHNDSWHPFRPSFYPQNYPRPANRRRCRADDKSRNRLRFQPRWRKMREFSPVRVGVR